jgi:hypothetical protein
MQAHDVTAVAHAALALNVAILKELAAKKVFNNDDLAAVMNSAIGDVAAHPNGQEIAAVLHTLIQPRTK